MINNVPRAKLNLLAIVMIGLLVVSVALAWLTTKPRKAFSPDGVGIISQLTNNTIEEYWSNADHKTWFVGQQPDGTPVIWLMRSRRKIPGGEFSGTIKTASYASSWKLNSDLSEGSYLGREFDKNNNKYAETQIKMTNDTVTVVRTHFMSGTKRSATSRRPANYIPEGALPLVMRLVASRGREMTFKMILDRNSIVGGNVNFLDVEIAPLENNIIEVKTHRRRSHSVSIYQLDSDNNFINKIKELDTDLTYIPYEEKFVRKLFDLPAAEPTSISAP
ncbi:MAG: hypothetical protein GY794_25665 [bacterium]|nr:hypothetical protein [bacterium]